MIHFNLQFTLRAAEHPSHRRCRAWASFSDAKITPCIRKAAIEETPWVSGALVDAWHVFGILYVMHAQLPSPLDMHRLAQIKGAWGVSMMAVLMRAKGMGCVDQSRFRSPYEVMRRKGWLKCEPGDDRTAPEEPRLIKDLATAEACPDPADLVFRLDCSLRDIRTFYAEVELDVPGSTRG